jgi:beta-phosphoglucomutase-like phosphatase (HAD superfamily)
MQQDLVDFDSLIGGWRGAFEAAHHALQAASHELSARELGERASRLATERIATVHLLDVLARERNASPMLVRLVASPWTAKRLLGLPGDTAACVFNVDGVLIASATIHAEAWKETFDEFVFRRTERTGGSFAHFSLEADYLAHIHGKSRLDAVREFLASRGISLSDGSPNDPPDAETVYGLANRKNLALHRRLERGDVSAYDGARLYLGLARDAKVRCAVVSGSTNAQLLLDRARLASLIDECVDGNTALDEHLRRKPAPDMLLAACRKLGAEPSRTVVFETTVDGVSAGRAGGFELVVAVDRGGEANALQAHGADVVVTHVGEILEHNLAA